MPDRLPERPSGHLPDRMIELAVIGRAHGVRGHMRVVSHAADPAALPGYGTLSDGAGRWFTMRWVSEGIAELSEIVDGVPMKIADRGAAERLTNTRLFIERGRLPAPEPDEYYLADLIGLAAFDADGARLGIVSAVHDHGAGASLEIGREDGASTLIPFTAACVPAVDIAGGRVTVAPPDEIDVPETRAAEDWSAREDLAAKDVAVREVAVREVAVGDVAVGDVARENAA